MVFTKDIQETSLSDSTQQSNISIEPAIYIPKYILITSNHLIFQMYTMLADYNAKIVF